MKIAKNTLILFLFAALAILAIAATPQKNLYTKSNNFSVLVFSKTAGFRHSSIPAGISAINNLAAQNNFSVTATEDAAAFNDANLAQFQAVIFLNTTGNVLNSTQQTAFENYIRGGGGYVGVHSAADTEYDWPWYGNLVGAYFASHPAIQQGTIKVADRQHPSSETLPARWTRTDEWYNFQSNPRGQVHVIATLDENTYSGGSMGHDHPITWCHEYEGGRAFYTAGGHTEASYSESEFLAHLLGGILFAAGEAEGECSATIESNFEKVILDDNTENPMELTVAPDGRVFYIERAGAVKVFDPATASVSLAGTIAVNTSNEDGLLGITVDPDFANNQWLYLFYSPDGPIAKQHVSRFTVTNNVLDMASEAVLLEIPTQRQECCHSAGSMTFDSNGNLFISTGDNTNPFESAGFAPIDERPGRGPWDAQKSSSNRNDLRGKILRITPQPDGSYTIPSGNLFPADGSDGRPEVYVMGCRNPFRISVDPLTNWLYWGDVGPDANAADNSRGPAGLDEWNQTRQAGNYGWPYFVGENLAYRDYDYASGQSGPPFDPLAPVNDSPNNSGNTLLPPAVDAWIWYPYGTSATFPELGSGGRTAMAGPVYHYDAANPIDTKLPAYYDKTLFIYEWSRNWIKEVKLDDNGDLLKINDFLPNMEFLRPMDIELGPDGSLYVLEWGSGFGGDNPDSRLSRIDFVANGRAPVISASATPSSGPLPLTVNFSSEGTFDPDFGDILSFSWDFLGDSSATSSDPNPVYTYTVAGNYVARLTVSDNNGNAAFANIPIFAGNTLPEVTIQHPVHGGFYNWGDSLQYNISVFDAEDGSTADGSIQCSDVVVQAFLGHDVHAHPLEEFFSCQSGFQFAAGHGGDAEDLFYVLEARYTDRGAPGVGPLTGRAEYLLNPRRIQSEHYDRQSGIQLEASGDLLGGGENIAFIDHGDYTVHSTINLHGIDFVTFRVASAGAGGRIEVRADAVDGPLLGTAYVEVTGGWQSYRNVTIPLRDPGGTHDLYFVYLNSPGAGGLFNVNWMEFQGDGISIRPAGQGDGLAATYYDNSDFSGDSLQRIDPMINFNWALSAPDSTMGHDTFSARWVGYLVPEVSDAYILFARAGDGVRLWFDGNLLIDEWRLQDVSEFSTATLQLTAGSVYRIEMEYFEAIQEAQAHLSWQTPSTARQTIPRQYLFSEMPLTAIEPGPPVAQKLQLHPAYPNPFNPEAVIRFDLPQAMTAKLTVYDALGRRVAVLVDRRLPAGRHVQIFDGSGLASGMYLYRLETARGSKTRRMLLVR